MKSHSIARAIKSSANSTIFKWTKKANEKRKHLTPFCLMLLKEKGKTHTNTNTRRREESDARQWKKASLLCTENKHYIVDDPLSSLVVRLWYVCVFSISSYSMLFFFIVDVSFSFSLCFFLLKIKMRKNTRCTRIHHIHTQFNSEIARINWFTYIRIRTESDLNLSVLSAMWLWIACASLLVDWLRPFSPGNGNVKKTR